MNLEAVQARRQALMRDADRIAGELERGKEVLHATRGAIQDCLFWENQLSPRDAASDNPVLVKSPVDIPETPRRRFNPVREVETPTDRPPNRVGQDDKPKA